MRKQDPSRRHSLSINTQIVVAVIALIGTLATAIFGYLGSRETKGGQDNNTQATSSSLFPSNTSIVTSPTTIVSSTTGQSEGIRVILDLQGTCDLAQVLPERIDPLKDPVEARNILKRASDDGSISTWEKSAGGTSTLVISFRIRNIGVSSWIELANNANITIRSSKDNLDDINVLHECAGTGVYRNFSVVPLDSTVSAYNIKATDKDAPFYTLQPGEFEAFNLPFECHAPGRYSVMIEIPYKSADTSSFQIIDIPDIVCPNAFTIWTTLASQNSLTKATAYKWNGNSYEEVSP